MYKTYLYRHFDKNDNLLYVGITNRYVARLDSHKRLSSWYEEIATVIIQIYPTRKKALKAEGIAIELENPIYNRFSGRGIRRKNISTKSITYPKKQK